MLGGYGLHKLTWDSADERVGDVLAVSPADAQGCGIELYVRQDGQAANLTGANVYFLWRHRRAGTQGCEPFTAVGADLGRFVVCYLAAMQPAFDQRLGPLLPLQPRRVPAQAFRLAPDGRAEQHARKLTGGVDVFQGPGKPRHLAQLRELARLGKAPCLRQPERVVRGGDAPDSSLAPQAAL